jgi:hypothetical protein
MIKALYKFAYYAKHPPGFFLGQFIYFIFVRHIASPESTHGTQVPPVGPLVQP